MIYVFLVINIYIYILYDYSKCIKLDRPIRFFYQVYYWLKPVKDWQQRSEVT